MVFDLDLLIVIAFLIFTLIVGLGHGAKTKTLKEYALGGRNFSTTALISTVVASWVSGSGFFITFSHTYSDGLYYLFATFGMTISFMIIAFFFVPRMGKFLGKTSIAEVMGDLYGNKVRLIVATSGILGSVGYIAVQFKAFGNIIGYFASLNPNITIILSGFIATLYSSYGGIRAVTFTDMLQFFAFLLVIPLIGIMIWNDYSLNYNFDIASAFVGNQFDYKNIFDFSSYKFWEMIPLFLYFAMPQMAPSLFQRISMGGSVAQIKKVFFISGILIIFVEIAMAWIPFLVFNINPNLDSNQVLAYVIENYTYPGLKGLVVVGVIAMAMSSADTDINTSSVLFSNDIFPYFKVNQENLLVSKIFSFTLGIGAIFFALSSGDLLSMILTTSSFYMPLVSTPLILTILGFRTTEKSILYGMAGGATTVLIWNIFDLPANPIFVAMLINAILLLGVHYLTRQKGGWVEFRFFNSSNDQEINQISFIKKVSNFKLLKFLQRHAQINESIVVGFGFYGIIYTLITMYASYEKPLIGSETIITTICQFMMLTSLLFVMLPIWPSMIKKSLKEKIIQIWWPIAIFYMMVVLNIFFVMLNNFSQLQFTIFITNIILSVFLVGWRLGIPMMLTGLYLGSQAYNYYIDYNKFSFEMSSPQIIVMYVSMLISAIVILFLKPQQEKQIVAEQKVKLLKSEVNYTKNELKNINSGMQKLEKKFNEKKGTLKLKELYLREQLKLRNVEITKLTEIKNEFVRNVMHESNTPMTGILSMCDVLYSYYDKLDEKDIKQSIKDIVNSGDRLKTYVNSISDLSKLSSLNFELSIKRINLSVLVKLRPKLYKKIFDDEAKKQDFIFEVEDNIIIEGDEYYLTQAIDNLISNSVKYGKGKAVTIKLYKIADSKAKFEIIDQGIGIPLKELISIFDKFTVSSRTRTPAEGRGVGLALCEKIIKVHKGKIWAESDGVSGSVFKFTLPRID